MVHTVICARWSRGWKNRVWRACFTEKIPVQPGLKPRSKASKQTNEMKEERKKGLPKRRFGESISKSLALYKALSLTLSNIKNKIISFKVLGLCPRTDTKLNLAVSATVLDHSLFLKTPSKASSCRPTSLAFLLGVETVKDLGLSLPRNCKLPVGGAPQAKHEFSPGCWWLTVWCAWPGSSVLPWKDSLHAGWLLENKATHSFHTDLGGALAGPGKPTAAFRDFLLQRKRREKLFMKRCSLASKSVTKCYLSVFAGLVR